MTWIYQGSPRDRQPRDVRRRWRPRDLICDKFLRGLRTADLAIYYHDSQDLGVKHLESTLAMLRSDHWKRCPAVGKNTCWWTPDLESQKSRVRARRRLYKRMLDPAQRGRHAALFKRRQAAYSKAMLNIKWASFRKFLSEKFATDKLVQCDVV